jgi:hypothetical protein
LRRRSEVGQPPTDPVNGYVPPAFAKPQPEGPQGSATIPAGPPPGANGPAEPPLRKRSEVGGVRPAELPAQPYMPPAQSVLPQSWGGPKDGPKEPSMFAVVTPKGLEEQQWESLAEKVHDVGNPDAKLAELKRAMSIDAEQTWRANPLIRANLATDAKALHLAAKLESKRRELNRVQVEAAANKKARAELQDEAEQVGRKGVISIAEVEAKVALDHGDEYERWELRKVKDKGMVEYLETLASNLSATIRGNG